MSPSDTNEVSELNRRAYRGGTAMIAGKILNQIIAFGVVWLQVHYLSVWAYGVFEMFMGTFFYIATLGNFGVLDIARRFLPEFAEKENRYSISITVRALLIVRFMAAAFFVILMVLCFDKIGPILNIAEYKSAFTLFAIGVLITMEATLLSYIYWALLKQAKYVLVFSIYNIFRLVAFYFALSSGGGLVAALAVDALSQLVLFLGLYIPFSTEYGLTRPAEYKPIPVKRMIHYGAYMYLGNLGHLFFNTTTDLYVISAFMGKIALGYYSFAVKISMAANKWMPDKLVGSVIETVLYRDYTRRNSSEALPEQFSKIVGALTFFIIPTAVFLIAFHEPLIRYIFDPKFLPAGGILAGLAIVFAISAIRFPLVLIATAKEKVKLLFAAQAIFAVYNLVADILLVPIWGLWGAVIATGSSMVFLIATLWIGLDRTVPLRVEAGIIIRVLINSAIMGLFFYFIKSSVHSAGTFFIAFAVGGALYLLLSYINCPFDKELLRKVWAVIKGLRSRNNTPE